MMDAMENKNLDPAQMGALTAPEGPLLILGGPGTGKTAALLARMRRFLFKSSAQGKVLFVAAGGSGMDAIEAEAGYLSDLKEAPVVTPPLLANIVLRLGGAEVVGLGPRYTLWSRSQARKLFIETVGATEKGRARSPAEISRVHEWYRRMRAGLPEGVGSAQSDEFRALVQPYQRLKEEAGCLDVDDLVPAAVRALSENADLRSRCGLPADGHMIVDDLHELSRAGLELVGLVSGDAVSVTATADPNLPTDRDSRGRHEPAAYLKERYRRGKIHVLPRDYRHSENLSATLSAFAAHEATPGLTPVTLQPVRSDGPAPVITDVTSDPVAIVDCLQESARELLQHGDDVTNLACVCRDDDLLRRLGEEMDRRNIPWEFAVSQDDRQEAPAAERAMDLLSWLLNPTDSRAFAAVAFSGPDAPPAAAVRQIVSQIFSGARNQGRNPVQSAEEMSRHFEPSDYTHRSLMAAVEAHRQLEAQLSHASPAELARNALALCGADWEEAAVQQSSLVGAARVLEADGPHGGRTMLAAMLDLCHPDLEWRTGTVPTGWTLTTGRDAPRRYWRGVFLIETTMPEGDRRESDREVFAALSSATERVFFLSLVHPGQDAPGGYSSILRESMERGREVDPHPGSAEPPPGEEPEGEPAPTTQATIGCPAEPRTGDGQQQPPERRPSQRDLGPTVRRTRPREGRQDPPANARVPGSLPTARGYPTRPGAGTGRGTRGTQPRIQPFPNPPRTGRGEFPIRIDWPCFILVVYVLLLLVAFAAFIVLSLKGII